jgi:hypothetical protein
MDTATWGLIGTLVGAVVGASASILTTLISCKNSVRLQIQANTLERLELARNFQKNNLLKLQYSLLQEMRLVGRAHLEDVEFHRKIGNKVKYNLLSKELDQELMISAGKVAILTERIADDALRDNLKELRKKMTDVVLLVDSEAESCKRLHIASTSFEQFMVQLGAVLRSYY